MMRRSLFGCCLLLALMPAASMLAKANLRVVDNDPPNLGFNDPTPATPIGGNPGTTLGQLRLNAFRHAANIWGRLLDSDVDIIISAQFSPIRGATACTATDAVLGQAWPARVVQNFSGAPESDTWYPIALANALAHRDLTPGQPHITAQFNADVDRDDCLAGSNWYYGFDGKHGKDVDLIVVLLHELGHGLGFSGSVDLHSGRLWLGKPNIFEKHVLDDETGLRWDQMTDAERVAASTSDGRIVWDGSATRVAADHFLAPSPRLAIKSSSVTATEKTYAISAAAFGAPVTLHGVTGKLAAAIDEANPDGPSTSDACTALTNRADVAGKIALVDRGKCLFSVKAQNVQDAGAIAMVVVEIGTSKAPPNIGGNDPSIHIPVVGVAKADGDVLRTDIAGGTRVRIYADARQPAGTDAAGYVKLYAPGKLMPGSSIFHFDISARPALLMEPGIGSELGHRVDLTLEQLLDIGWTGDEPTPASDPGDLEGHKH